MTKPQYGPEVESLSGLVPGEIYWYRHREWKVVYINPTVDPTEATLLSKGGEHREQIFPLTIKPGYGAPIRKVLKPTW